MDNDTPTQQTPAQRAVAWMTAAPARLAVALVLLFLLGFLARGCFTASTPAPGPDATLTEPAPDAVEVWTCSMHPQIRSPRPGLCPLCNMDLIPLSEDAVAGPRVFATSEEAAALMAVRTVPVERRFVEAGIRMVGKVAYDETRLAYITAWVPGRIDELFVDYTGIRVNRGDHMVALYSPELISAQEELRLAAQAQQRATGGAATVRQTAQATLDAARDRLRLWGLTPEQIAEAERGGAYADHVTIYAPIGGTVIERQGTEGQYVEVGTPIYTLADFSQMWVLLDAYESDLQWLRYGQRVVFTAEAYPGDRFEGTVAFIAPVLDPQTRTAKVRVNVENPEGKLKPEMFVRAVAYSSVAEGGRVMAPDLSGKLICPMHPEVVSDEPGDCPVCGMDLVPVEDMGYVPVDELDQARPLVIPVSAALITGTRAIVYVQMPDMDRPTFEGREVVLGPRAGDYYLVRSGLAEGDRVVVEGNFKIDSALQLVARPSMMLPEDEAAGVPPPDAVDVRLSYAARQQFDSLLAAYTAVEEAQAAGDHTRLAARLGAFADAVEAVAFDHLPGDAHGLWASYRTRLTNDAVEARSTADERVLAQLLASLRQRMAEVTDRMGLRPDEGDDAWFDTPEPFRLQVRDLYEAYLAIQTALAGDDVDAARAAADRAATALGAVDAGLLDDDARVTWTPIAETMAQAVADLRAADALAPMRVAFEPLSDHLNHAIRTLGIAPGPPVYQVHCPMAFDGRGADWLQAGTEVLNPYYGASMLRCGDVVDRIDERPEAVATDAPAEVPRATAPAAFQAQLREVYTAYVTLQRALANDNEAGSREAVAPLAQAAAAVDMGLLTGADHEAWMPIAEALSQGVSALEAADDFAALRIAFQPVSNALADAIARFGIAPGTPVYRLHCPMAFDFAGADWLQPDEAVLNPYFGDEMLTCGRVVERVDAPLPETGP